MSIRERKEREKKLRKQQIRNAAKEVFIIKGVNSTTVEDIAKKAELSPATIYQYFENKNHLYASINLEILEYLLKEIEKVSNNKRLSVQKKMMKFKDAMYKTFQYDSLLLRNVVHEQVGDTFLYLNKSLLEKLNFYAKKIMNIIANIYEEGVREGKFRPGNPMAHADILWAVFTGLMVWEETKKTLDPKKDFLKPTLDKAFEIFCLGIEKE